MPKPIVLISFHPDIHPDRNIDETWAALAQLFEERLPDYHTFTILNNKTDEYVPPIDLRVFYEKDFTEIQYAELKSMLEESIKSLKQEQ